MKVFLTEAETVEAVAGLTHSRLHAFVKDDVLAPMQAVDGLLFSPVEVARLELLCDLVEQFDLDGDALGIVMSLIDQLHASRHKVHAMARALEVEPVEIRHRIGVRIVAALHKS